MSVDVLNGWQGYNRYTISFKTYKKLATLPQDRCSREPVVHTLIQCTPLLVEKAGVAPDVTLGFTMCKQVSVQVREPPWY